MENKVLGIWISSCYPHPESTLYLFLFSVEQNEPPESSMEKGSPTYVWRLLLCFMFQMYPFPKAFSPSWGNMKDRRILTLLGYGISPYKKNSEDWKINSPSYKRFWINLQLGDSWIKEWMQSYGTVPNCSPKKPYLCMFLQTMNEAVHILNGPNCINTFSIIVFQ